VSGKVEAGRYYVSNHGRLTEVGHAAFVYSQIHAHSLFITHPLAMVAGVILWLQQKR
jgi:hypothetical protein